MDDAVDDSARSSVSSLKSRFEQLASRGEARPAPADTQLSAQQRLHSTSPSAAPTGRSRSIDEPRTVPRLSIDGLAPRELLP